MTHTNDANYHNKIDKSVIYSLINQHNAFNGDQYQTIKIVHVSFDSTNNDNYRLNC